MTTINLKDFYAWYTHDEYIEVSDEVAAELKADKLYEAAHQRRTTRNKAQYSLDCDDGIEYSACLHEPTPQELLDRMELFIHLWNALNSLPEVQGVPEVNEQLHALQKLLGRWLMQAGGIFDPVIAVQRILRLVPGEPPLVGHLIAGIGLEYLGHLVRNFDVFIMGVPSVKVLQIDGRHLYFLHSVHV